MEWTKKHKLYCIVLSYWTPLTWASTSVAHVNDCDTKLCSSVEAFILSIPYKDANYEVASLHAWYSCTTKLKLCHILSCKLQTVGANRCSNTISSLQPGYNHIDFKYLMELSWLKYSNNSRLNLMVSAILWFWKHFSWCNPAINTIHFNIVNSF